MAYRFGSFLYDPTDRALFRDGAEVPLTHKSRDLLLLFLENPRRTLLREMLVERVWGGVAVTDEAVRAQIVRLRRALGDAGDDLVRSVRQEGYRWEGDVWLEDAPRGRPVPSVLPRGPRFRLVLEDRELQLLDGENVIGRDSDSALWIDDVSVSRRHARVVVTDGRARLDDLESKNGTFLNGRRISGPEPLANGDEIRVGVVQIYFRTLLRLSTTRPEPSG